MSRTQANEQMNVVFHSADYLRNSSQPANGAAEIFVQSWTPDGFNQRTTLFRGENYMVVEGEKG